MHSFMSENIMAVKQQKNVDRNNIDNAIFTETANMPLTSNADRPYPACFLTNSVHRLNDVILLMFFFIALNHFPFKKKHRRI